MLIHVIGYSVALAVTLATVGGIVGNIILLIILGDVTPVLFLVFFVIGLILGLKDAEEKGDKLPEPKLASILYGEKPIYSHIVRGIYGSIIIAILVYLGYLIFFTDTFK